MVVEQQPKNNHRQPSRAFIHGLVGALVGTLVSAAIIGMFSLALEARNIGLLLAKDIESDGEALFELRTQLAELEKWRAAWVDRVRPLDEHQNGRLDGLERRVGNLE